MGKSRLSGPVSATLAGVFDRFSRAPRIEQVAPGAQLDGKTCLVTGANSGLGLATAIALAKRGGRMILACRSSIPETAARVSEESQNPHVDVRYVDLADTASIHHLCDGLRDDGVVLDVAVFNAGLMPRRARPTAQGYEVMFGVHFLANRLLLQRWLNDGVVVPRSAARPSTPRLIFVSSETHKSASPIDFDSFGEFVDYGIRTGMEQYGSTKLHLSTLACELSRRLNPSQETLVAVHSLCPGPINSNISRETPAVFRPLLSGVMRLLFNSPAVAAQPIEYLACSEQLEGQTGLHLHMMRESEVGAEAKDESKGRLLWERSAALLARHPPSGAGESAD